MARELPTRKQHGFTEEAAFCVSLEWPATGWSPGAKKPRWRPDPRGPEMPRSLKGRRPVRGAKAGLAGAGKGQAGRGWGSVSSPPGTAGQKLTFWILALHQVFVCVCIFLKLSPSASLYYSTRSTKGVLTFGGSVRRWRRGEPERGFTGRSPGCPGLSSTAPVQVSTCHCPFQNPRVSRPR